MNLSASLVLDITPVSEAHHQPRDKSLSTLRSLLSQGRNRLKADFETRKLSGVQTAQALSQLTDDILRQSAQDAGLSKEEQAVCICAVAGYGAGLLAPFSDIELLFLIKDKVTPLLEKKIIYILHNLSDLGLRVSHKISKIDDALEEARENLTFCTSLLDIRPIYSNFSLVTALREQLSLYLRKTELQNFLHAKIEERNKRHQQFGDTPYLVEPHLKEGRGGLRDLQSLNWMGRAVLQNAFPLNSNSPQFDFIQACLSLGLLSEREALRTKKLWNFLWAVRIHLHYISNRAEERLSFDIQSILGARMSYAYHRKQRAVERFMRHYYLIARGIMRITHILQPALLIHTHHQNQKSTTHIEEGPSIFQRVDGRLDVKDPSLFRTQPITLFRFLETARTHGLKLSPSVKQHLIRHERYYSSLRGNEEAARCFLSLLCEPILKKEISVQGEPQKEGRFWLPILNEIGLLSRYFHPWSRILGLTQFENTHSYTADEHTIESVRILRQIEAGRIANEIPFAHKIAQQNPTREVVYIATLLHNIGKASHGNYSENGAEIAYDICQQLHISPDDTDHICWLIAHHLLLSQAAFSRNIDDPYLILDLADIIQSPERLKLLLLLTISHIAALHPRSWNEWKAAQLQRLYCHIADVLEGGLHAQEGDMRVHEEKAHLEKLLADKLPQESIERFLSQTSPAYWLSFDTNTHLKHAFLIHDYFHPHQAHTYPAQNFTQDLLLQTENIGIILTALPQRGISELTIFCPDRPGLFNIIAGILTLHGASISDARIHTLHNHMALDSFWIQNPHGEAFEEKNDIEMIKESLLNALTLTEKQEQKEAPPKQLSKAPSAPYKKSLYIPTRVMIDNQSAPHATIMEINGRDRAALLHDITEYLRKKAIIIQSAHITTYGLRAVDIFYLQNEQKEKLSEEDVQKLQEELREIISFS